MAARDLTLKSLLQTSRLSFDSSVKQNYQNYQILGLSQLKKLVLKTSFQAVKNLKFLNVIFAVFICCAT